jgi:hypothetical protein
MCRLNDDEFRDRASQLAATLEDLGAEESRQEMLKREMKSAPAVIEARRDQLGLVVSRCSELRPVEVEDRVNGSDTVERIRMDTGEVIHARPLADGERQLPLGT